MTVALCLRLAIFLLAHVASGSIGVTVPAAPIAMPPVRAAGDNGAIAQPPAAVAVSSEHEAPVKMPAMMKDETTRMKVAVSYVVPPLAGVDVVVPTHAGVEVVSPASTRVRSIA